MHADSIWGVSKTRPRAPMSRFDLYGGLYLETKTKTCEARLDQFDPSLSVQIKPLGCEALHSNILVFYLTALYLETPM